MALDPRWRWAVYSGLTRAEQKVLVFLIAVIGAGLVYNGMRDTWRDEPLALHRAGADSASADDQTSATASEPGGPLDLNRASAAELEGLPGIGPVLAGAIVRHRETQGPFRRLEDLKDVPGVGDKIFAKLAPLLEPIEPPAPTPTPMPVRQAAIPASVAPAPTPGSAEPLVDINTAGLEELDTLYGIGPALAQRIIDHRGKNGPFRRIEDIQKVSGIGEVIFERNRARLTIGGPKP